jgi:general secretion pathway protein B
MSYILEALRRAQNERTRGQVPGLDAQAITLAGGDDPAAPRPGSRAASALPRAVALVAAGVGLAALAWWIGRGAGPSGAPPSPDRLPPVATLPPQPAAPPPAALPPQAAWTATAPGAPAAAVSRVPSTSQGGPAGVPGPVSPGVKAVTGEIDRATPQPLRTAQPMPAVPTVPLPPSAGGPAAVSSPAPPVLAEPAIATVRLADLTAQQRGELPPMAIGGAIYSDSPAARFVLVNGQVVREGEGAAPGVTLERIGSRSAVLRWRDLRIEVPY